MCNFFNSLKVNDTDVLIVTLDQSLNYLSAEYFKTAVEKKVIREYPSIDHIFISGMSINYSVDVTVVKVSVQYDQYFNDINNFINTEHCCLG